MLRLLLRSSVPTFNPVLDGCVGVRLRRMRSTGDARLHRFDSTLLANPSIVEFDAQILGDVLDGDDEFCTFFALLNAPETSQ